MRVTGSGISMVRIFASDSRGCGFEPQFSSILFAFCKFFIGATSTLYLARTFVLSCSKMLLLTI